MSLPRQIVAVCALTASVAVGIAESSTAGADPEGVEAPVNVSPDAPWYSKTYGVTLEEADTALKYEELAGRLDAAISEGEGKLFGGL